MQENIDHEWGQNYQEIISSMPELSFDESFDVVPGPTCDHKSSPKLSSLSSNGGGGLFPKASIGKLGTRRRSRASKKVPTTLLTADANNFRALVQQFTGCHSAPPTFGTHKGPINLNFEQRNYYSEKPEDDQQQQVDWSLNYEESEQSFFSFRTTNNVATTRTTTMNADRELFASRVNHNSRSDPLTIDDFDIDNFSTQEIMSGPGDYSTVLPGTSDDDLWGY